MTEVVNPGWCSSADMVNDHGISIFELFEYIKTGLPAYTYDHEAVVDSDYLVNIKKVLHNYFRAKIKNEHHNRQPHNFEMDALVKYEYKIRFDKIFDHPDRIKLLSFNELLKNTLSEVWAFQFKINEVVKFFDVVSNNRNAMPSYDDIVKEKELQAWEVVSEILEVSSEEIQKVAAAALRNETWGSSEEIMSTKNEYNPSPSVRNIEPSLPPTPQKRPENQPKLEGKRKKRSSSNIDEAKILEQIDQCQTKKESLVYDAAQSKMLKNRSMILAGFEEQSSEKDNSLIGIILDNRSAISDLVNTRGTEGEREYQASNLINLLAGSEEIKNAGNEYKQTHGETSTMHKENLSKEPETKEERQNIDDFIKQKRQQREKVVVIAAQLKQEYGLTALEIARKLKLGEDLNPTQLEALRQRGQRAITRGKRQIEANCPRKKK
jgi:hypothetical protein